MITARDSLTAPRANPIGVNMIEKTDIKRKQRHGNRGAQKIHPFKDPSRFPPYYQAKGVKT